MSPTAQHVATVVLYEQLSAGAPELHAYIYNRISDDKTGRAAGVGRQHEDTTRWATEAGATHLHYFVDNDLSASKVDVVRVDFQRLIKTIESGEADGGIVVTWAQDRMARQGKESEQMFELFEEHRIRFLAPTDGIDMRPGDGALYPRIRAAVAAEEVRKLRVRVNRALLQNRIAGQRHGKVPFGWDKHGAPDPERAALVVEATNRVLEGDSMRSIARDWNERGVPRQSFTKRKINGIRLAPEEEFEVVSEWTGHKVHDLVVRQANAGLYEHKGTTLDVRGQWTPLVPEDRWAAVTAMLAAQKQSKARAGATQRHLLGGVMLCEKNACGGAVWGLVNRSGGYTYNIYRCGRCQQAIKMGLVEAFVDQLMVNKLTDMSLADLATDDRKAAMKAASDRADALRARLVEADDRYSDVGPHAIDAAQHARITSKLKPALLEAEVEAMRLSDGRLEALHGLTGVRAAVEWDAASDDRKRTVIKLLVRLTLLPGDRRTPIEHRVHVTWTKITGS